MEEVKSILIKDLHKSYGNKEVLKGINLEVNQGELFGFIGRNGVGKSTTIDCCIGLKPFNSGEIYIDGMSIKDKPLQVKDRIGYSSSEPITYEEMTGYGYLEFIASIYRLDSSLFLKNFTLLSKRFDLQGSDLYKPIKEYSHGMKQKVSLIASLIHSPSIWVLDEPTVGLDPFTSNSLIETMKEYVKSGKTCFVATHNIELIASIADRVAIINNGVIAKVLDLKSNGSLRYSLKDTFFKIYKEGQQW